MKKSKKRVREENLAEATIVLWLQCVGTNHMFLSLWYLKIF